MNDHASIDIKRIYEIYGHLLTIKKSLEVNKALKFMEWIVLRFWGGDISKHTEDCVRVIEDAIIDRRVGKPYGN